MFKKVSFWIGASVVLFVVLAALILLEIKYPEGGVVLLQNLLGNVG